MEPLTRIVEKKISATLQSKFALLFDGWSSGSTSYLAVFATFIKEESSKYEKILLGFSPFESEENLSAVEHKSLIGFILNVHGKS